jgi:hypothetical protein
MIRWDSGLFSPGKSSAITGLRQGCGVAGEQEQE